MDHPLAATELADIGVKSCSEHPSFMQLRRWSSLRFLRWLLPVLTLNPPTPAQNAAVESHLAEIVAKADSLLRERYSPSRTVPLFYDKEHEAGPSNGPIYWFDSNYVVQLMFATDGSLARVELLPESLLYSNSWSSVSDSVELDQGEIHWFIKTANQLRPTGAPVEIHEPPDACFQSGPNLYCHDWYEDVGVSEYCREQYQPDKRGTRTSPKSVTVGYKQSVRGIISAVKVVSPEDHQVKIGQFWYGIHKFSNKELFNTATVGSIVSLTTVGCTANELVCEAAAANANP